LVIPLKCKENAINYLEIIEFYRFPRLQFDCQKNSCLKTGQKDCTPDPSKCAALHDLMVHRLLNKKNAALTKLPL